MAKKQVGEERIYSAYTSTLLFITKEVRTATEQELIQWPWSDVLTGLLPLACSACSLIEPKTTSPEMVGPTRGLPPWSLIEKMPHSWISQRHFPNWSSFLCDNSSFCQVDINPTSTIDLLSTWHTITSLVSLNPYILIHPQDLNNFKSPTVLIFWKFQSF